MACWTREFVIEFIELYQQHECLWNVKNKNYHNKAVKERSYRVMAKKMQEVEHNATKDSVCRKINNMRSTFRKELRKVLLSKGSSEIHVPKLWYFHHLLFLADEEIPPSALENSDLLSDSEKAEEDEDLENAQMIEYLEVESPEVVAETVEIAHKPQRNYTTYTSQRPSPSVVKLKEELRKRRFLPDPVKSARSLSSSKLRKLGEFKSADDVNEFDIFGKIVAKQLKQLPLEDALEIQIDIQNMIGQRRLKIIRTNSTSLPQVSFQNPLKTEEVLKECIVDLDF